MVLIKSWMTNIEAGARIGWTDRQRVINGGRNLGRGRSAKKEQVKEKRVHQGPATQPARDRVRLKEKYTEDKEKAHSKVDRQETRQLSFITKNKPLSVI